MGRLFKENDNMNEKDYTSYKGDDEVMEGDIVQIDYKAKKQRKKKKLIIFLAIIIVIVAAVVVFWHQNKFERVKNEVVHIVGSLEGDDDYFKIDTYPEEYNDMDEVAVAILGSGAQERALKAIRYANDELGFNGSLYSRMLETTALMGRQSEENNKYKVFWTYHPDNGLEVTYEKK